MINKKNILFLILIITPVLAVFRNFFLINHLVWGDAPYFYFESMKYWMSGSFVWTNIGANLGGINLVVWLSPLMYLYGFLGDILKINNDLIIRILFYFPAVVASLVGSYIFTRYLKLSKTVGFYTALIYTLNTYFLLLIDGGQVGVSLAYGMFPVTILFLKQAYDQPLSKNIFLGFTMMLLLTLVDPRITVIAFLTIFLWMIVEFFVEGRKSARNYLSVILIAVLLIPVNLFWIIPLLTVGGLNLSLQVSNFKFLSLLNSLTLFNPHWPNNVYGVINQPFWYFIFLPLLIFGGLFVKHKNKLYLIFVLMFLIFGFLSKGETAPLGQIYSFILNKIPMGSVFRDSTKFFIPLILFAGILIGTTIDILSKKMRYINIFCYLYLLFLVWPALTGKLNFVLSNREHSLDYTTIYQNLNKDRSSFSTLWFPERHPLSFQTDTKMVIDAKSLVDLRPFASLNVGTSDRFNFLHNKQAGDWLQLFGIKYLIFSGDARKVTLSQEEVINWNTLLELAKNLPFLKKTNWDVSIPAYEVVDPKPKIFGVDKLLVVVGGDSIYSKIKNPIGSYGTVFVEDGITIPKNIINFASDSLSLVFNNKDVNDLTLSFLKDYFLPNIHLSTNDWAYYPSSDYLLWKYQLLIRGLDINEFDYGSGIFLSTLEGENIVFNFETSKTDDYIVAIRSLAGSQDSVLQLNYSDKIYSINQKTGNFSWYTLETNIQSGSSKLVITNKKGLEVVNVVAVIPKSIWNESQLLTNDVLRKYQIDNFDSKFSEVEFTKNSPVEYTINKNSDFDWLVFTDNYHPLWIVGCDGVEKKSLPFYSAINGFYVKDCKDKIDIEFTGQKYATMGKKISLVALLIILTSFLVIRRK